MSHVHLSYNALNIPSIKLPDGSIVFPSGSTTGGVQEAINYAEALGTPLIVDGPSAPVQVSTTITVGATLGRHYEFRGLSLQSTAVGPVLRFDALVAGAFLWDAGVIERVGGSGEVVLLMPQNQAPPPWGTAGGGRILKFGRIQLPILYVSAGSAPAVMKLDPNNGAIVDQRIEVAALHGGNITPIGILVANGVEAVPAAYATAENRIEFNYIGGVTSVGIKVGTGPIDHTKAPINSSYWSGCINCDGGDMLAYVETYAEHEQYNIHSAVPNAGSCQYGLIVRSSAHGNIATMPQLQATVGAMLAETGAIRNKLTAPDRGTTPIGTTGDPSNQVIGDFSPAPAPISSFEGTTGAFTGSALMGSYTVLDQSWSVDNGKIVNKLWFNTTAAGSYTLKLLRKNSAGNYDVMVSQAISHGGTGLEGVSIIPFTVPSDGKDYFVGAFAPGTHPLIDMRARAYVAGNLSSNTTAMVEEPAHVSWFTYKLGVSYGP